MIVVVLCTGLVLACVCVPASARCAQMLVHTVLRISQHLCTALVYSTCVQHLCTALVQPATLNTRRCTAHQQLHPPQERPCGTYAFYPTHPDVSPAVTYSPRAAPPPLPPAGAGPVTGLIVPELNPAESRGRAVSAAFVSHWVCNMAIGQTFLGAVAAYGLATVYAGFGAVALVGLMYISRAVPETKGKSFEQIQADLAV